jgi:branched-chain amino acid transport system substrate-binding protein
MSAREFSSTAWRTVAMAGAVAMLAAVAGCASDGGGDAGGTDGSTGAADCTTKFLVSTNVTGAGATNGEGNIKGIDAALEQINGEGGVLGCTVTYDVVDDGSDYTKALPNVQGKLAQEDYSFVYSGDFGGPSVAPYLTRQEMLGIFASGVPTLTDDNPTVFDVSVPSPGTAGALFDYIASQDITDVALIVDTTSTGDGAIAAYSPAAEAAGVTISVTERVDLASINMTPAVQRVEASGAQALVANVYGQAAGYLLRDFKASGWDVPFFGGYSVFSSPLTDIVPEEDVAGAVAVGSASATFPSTDAQQEMIDIITEQTGEPITTGLASMFNGHDAVTLWAWAANGAGSLDTDEIVSFLEENGDTEVPNLGNATTTNYSADNHAWYPKDGVAIAKLGPLDQGRLERIELLDATQP